MIACSNVEQVPMRQEDRQSIGIKVWDGSLCVQQNRNAGRIAFIFDCSMIFQRGAVEITNKRTEHPLPTLLEVSGRCLVSCFLVSRLRVYNMAESLECADSWNAKDQGN